MDGRYEWCVDKRKEVWENVRLEGWENGRMEEEEFECNDGRIVAGGSEDFLKLKIQPVKKAYMTMYKTEHKFI